MVRSYDVVRLFPHRSSSRFVGNIPLFLLPPSISFATNMPMQLNEEVSLGTYL